MHIDSSPPIDPRLHEALLRQQIEPGPIVPEETLQDVAARSRAAWDALAARSVDGAMERPRGAQRVRRHATAGRSWVGFAVAVLCAVGLTAILVSRFRSEAPTTHYQTAAGQVSRVVLSGGTVMTLAPATSVAVSGTRGGAAVDVVGEASFTVTHSSGYPFVVRTGNAVVQVLGTAFSVRRYANELHTQVVVEDGKVAVRAKRHGVVSEGPTAISARMLAQVSDSGVLVQSGIDPRTYTGLTTGSLVFTEVPLEKVVAELSRAYGVDIRVADSALARQIITMTAAFAREPLSHVLEILVRITDAHVTRAGDAFVVVPGRIANPGVPQQQFRRFPQPEKSYGR